jgi:chromosome condensin MukBEF ATPase and DNA-binding subunit MukB
VAIDEREFGQLEARMEVLEREMKEMRADMRYVRDAISTAQGSWKTMAWVIGVSGIAGAMSAKFLAMLLR